MQASANGVCTAESSLFLSLSLSHTFTRLILRKSIYHVRSCAKLSSATAGKVTAVYRCLFNLVEFFHATRYQFCTSVSIYHHGFYIARVHLRFYVNESLCFPRSLVALHLVISCSCPTATAFLVLCVASHCATSHTSFRAVSVS